MMLSSFMRMLALCGYAPNGKSTSGGGIGLKSAGVLAQSAVPASVTGTTTETTVATIQLPALSPNTQIRIWTSHTTTNNANIKTTNARINGVSLGGVAVTSAVTSELLRKITNRGATNSQLCTPTSSGSSLTVSTGSYVVTGTETSASTTLTLTITLAVGTDTGILEGYTVEILNP